VYCFAQEGTLSGNWIIDVELPHAFMPRHVSAYGTAGAATIKIGDDSDDDCVLEAQSLGSGGDNPSEFGPSDFADADYQYSKGDVMKITITDTNIEDPTIVITGLFGE
jgi:hypothetical protein